MIIRYEYNCDYIILQYIAYPKLSMLAIFAYIPMLAWEANIGILAPRGYMRKIRFYFCRNLVILPEFIGKYKFIQLRTKLCCQKVVGQSWPTS